MIYGGSLGNEPLSVCGLNLYGLSKDFIHIIIYKRPLALTEGSPVWNLSDVIIEPAKFLRWRVRLAQRCYAMFQQ